MKSKRDPSQLDPQHLWGLKNGEDRGGQQRTWAEVGEMTGYSHQYVRFRAHEYKHELDVVVVDPRQYWGGLADMSDDDVAKWQAQPYCLCGCACPTKQEHKSGQRMPRGAYRAFVNGHAITTLHRGRTREEAAQRRSGKQVF